MDSTIVQSAYQWTLGEPDGLNYQDILDQIESRAEAYDEYHPTIGPFSRFDDRLVIWLNAATHEEDRKIMLRMVPEILYLSSADFISLYRTAYNELVLPWLIEKEGLTITDADITDRLKDGISKTWFCSITDSMHISDFYHVNNIGGVDFRPDWRCLKEFAEISKIENNMVSNGFHYLVLLEDFIGSGDQASLTLEFAANLPKQYPVLVVPLVICAEGLKAGKSLQAEHGNLTFEPVITLEETDLVSQYARRNEPELFALIRDVCDRLARGLHWRYGAFGFHNTGALFVAYTNCPDNTLSIINDDSGGEWEPLFPRSSRT